MSIGLKAGTNIQIMQENRPEISMGEVERARKCLWMCAVRMRPKRTDDWVGKGDGRCIRIVIVGSSEVDCF